MNGLPPEIAALLGGDAQQQPAPDWWAYGKRPQAMARGGMPAAQPARGALASDVGAVKGPGSGRDDKIPALLSDNEHVLDAEVVALAGDGSSDEGHRRIEKWKADLRRSKGKKLAKGAISDDAALPDMRKP